MVYRDASQDNKYPNCKASASVARQRILPLFNGWKMQYTQMETIQGVSSASSKHHASMPVASTIWTPGSLPTMLAFVPAFFHQLEVWGGALPVLTPGGLTSEAASCSGFEKLVVWVHLVIRGTSLRNSVPWAPYGNC